MLAKMGIRERLQVPEGRDGIPPSGSKKRRAVKGVQSGDGCSGYTRSPSAGRGDAKLGAVLADSSHSLLMVELSIP